MHYLLFYEVGEDYVARRAPFRDEHLRKAREASERGELVLGGAFANPVDGAVLLFRGDSPEVAEKFARNDPYVIHGAVKRWHVREWNTVVGAQENVPSVPGFTLDEFPVAISIPVLWSDEDAYGHINNTIYLRWAEAARIEYLMRIGEWQRSITNSAGPILASISCDYRLPVTHPDTVHVGARVTAIGNSSFKMVHSIVSATHRKIAAEVESTIVLFDYPNNRTARVPDHMRTAIEALEGRELPRLLKSRK